MDKLDSNATGAKRQHHSREFKIEAVRQFEQGQATGAQLALMLV